MRLLVIDFEATCWEVRPDPFIQEIIEIGCAVVDPESLKTASTYSAFIKPVYNPQLSDFCVSLTGITQSFLDINGKPFKEVVDDFCSIVQPEDIFCSWGAFDYNIMKNNCEIFKCDYPFKTGHVNVKPLLGRLMKNWRSSGIGLAKAIWKLGMTFQGQQHSGIDDAKNVVRVLSAVNDKISSTETSLLEEIKKISQGAGERS